MRNLITITLFLLAVVSVSTRVNAVHLNPDRSAIGVNQISSSFIKVAALNRSRRCVRLRNHCRWLFGKGRKYQSCARGCVGKRKSRRRPAIVRRGRNYCQRVRNSCRKRWGRSGRNYRYCARKCIKRPKSRLSKRRPAIHKGNRYCQRVRRSCRVRWGSRGPDYRYCARKCLSRKQVKRKPARQRPARRTPPVITQSGRYCQNLRNACRRSWGRTGPSYRYCARKCLSRVDDEVDNIPTRRDSAPSRERTDAPRNQASNSCRKLRYNCRARWGRTSTEYKHCIRHCSSREPQSRRRERNEERSASYCVKLRRGCRAQWGSTGTSYRKCARECDGDRNSDVSENSAEIDRKEQRCIRIRRECIDVWGKGTYLYKRCARSCS
ncbi:MAG: hypothetical protein ACRBBN_03755 [Methyloligellaceae bacterium]